jgi:HEAT repeat protein
LHDPYIVLIFALFVCWTLSFHFVDNLFLERLHAQFADKVSLANFLGIYSVVVGLSTFLSGALLTAPFLNRFGVSVGAYALPVTLAVCLLPFLVTGSIWGLVPFLFWPAFAAKVLDFAVDPIDRATRTILYQPISEHLRVRVQMITEGILRPLVTGIAGVILLFITVIFGLNAIFIGYALLGILLIWIVVARRMSGAYPAMLMQALVRRRLGEVELTLDKASVDVLLRSLDTPYADAVIFAVEQLEDQNHPALAGALVRLLDHSSPLVRSDMLARIERLRLLEALPALRRLAVSERDPAVRSALFCTLAALGAPDEVSQLTKMLTDEDLAVRRGVATGLLIHGDAVSRASVQAALRAWHTSAHPPQRALLASVAGATGDEETTALLGQLLQDSDSGVQLAALEAVAQLRDGRYWSLVVDKLDDPELHQAAQNTLVAGGEEPFEAVADALRRPDLSPSMLLRLATLCGRLQIPALSALLAVHSEVADVTVRRHILVALQRAEYHAEGERAEQFLKQIEDEVLTVAWTMAAIRDLDGDDSVRLLRSALELELQHQTVRLLCMLSFVVDARPVRQAQQTLASPRSTEQQRAFALEVLELVTPQSVKSLILPVIDDVPLVQRLRKLGDRYRHPPLPLPARLRDVVANARRLSDWSLACTVEAIGRLDLPQLADVIPDVSASPALVRRPLVREAALLANSSQPASPNSLAGLLAEERPMLSTFEKVLILKSVSIFDRVPDDALAIVATALQEQEAVDGELIFAKGDPASAMYIIVVGSVSVHDGAHMLNQLGPREVFGEMALFDAEARSASVSSLGDTLLLRLDQEAFLELLDDHSAISLGIIRVLSQRLRARTEDLSRLRAGLPVAGA